jgi:hypothetical protein
MPTLIANQPIIRDYFPLKPLQVEREVISEGINPNKRKCTRLTSLAQKADWANENGRYYPYSVMVEAVNELQPAIKSRRVLVELDHPQDAMIHTENVCCLLSKLWMEKKDVYAMFEILEGMPKADMLKCLIVDHGVTYSVSSRGVGDMEDFLLEDGREVNKVLPGFKFVTFDVVQDPSVQGTTLHIAESRIITKNNGIRRAKEKELIKITKKILSQN